MKAPLTLMKPFKQRSKSAAAQNMFQDPDRIQGGQGPARENVEHYDFIGPQEVRKRAMTKYGQPMKADIKNNQTTPEQAPFNQTSTSKNPFNTTINRNTMFDSLHKQQQIQYTKQSRNIERFREYQDFWQKKKSFLKNNLNKKLLLMDTNIKPLYVHENQPKNVTINEHIVHYWEMSLRNNNPILERHIKGHKFGPVEKEKLLQLREGTKRVEKSIPALPLDKLKDLDNRELSLNGRNKVKREAEDDIIQMRTRYSLPTSSRGAPEEVLKINYDGHKKWMGAQNM